jgi:hypothetical protein
MRPECSKALLVLARRWSGNCSLREDTQRLRGSRTGWTAGRSVSYALRMRTLPDIKRSMTASACFWCARPANAVRPAICHQRAGRPRSKRWSRECAAQYVDKGAQIVAVPLPRPREVSKIRTDRSAEILFEPPALGPHPAYSACRWPTLDGASMGIKHRDFGLFRFARIAGSHCESILRDRPVRLPFDCDATKFFGASVHTGTAEAQETNDAPQSSLTPTCCTKELEWKSNNDKGQHENRQLFP